MTDMFNGSPITKEAVALGLSNGQFSIVLQPQFSNETLRLVGAEAYVRWQHPQRGMLTAGSFIGSIAELGMIGELDRFVVKTVADCLSRWKLAGLNPPPVSVNMDRSDFYDRDLRDFMIKQTGTSDIPPSLLRLEVTEKDYLKDAVQFVASASELKQLGLGIAMDNFGTDLSYLNVLKSFSPDLIKLDMDFLRAAPHIEDSYQNDVVLKSLLHMMKLMHIPVIARGVEDKNQAEYLRELGCEYVQGYFYAKPMEVAAYTALLKSSNIGALKAGIGTAEEEYIAQRNAERALAERYKLLSENTNIMTFDADIRTGMLYYSINDKNATIVSGQSHDLTSFIKSNRHIHPSDRSTVRSMFIDMKTGRKFSVFEVRLDFYGTGYRWYRLYCVTIGESSNPTRIVGRITDIQKEREDDAKRREAENLLRRKAETDAMTGLLNKSTLQARVEQIIALPEDGDGYWFYMIDVDNFKQVNDTYGHSVGDKFLKEVGQALKALFREKDIAGRIGGDEFAVILVSSPNFNPGAKAEQILAVIREISIEPYQNIHCSIGITAVTPEDTDYEHVLDRADSAMYEAKRRGKDRYVIYDRSLEQSLSGALIGAKPALAEILPEDTLTEHIIKLMYGAANFEQVMPQVLETLGKAYNVSRVYIFENSYDNMSFSNTFEWCNEGIEPIMDQCQNISYDHDRGGLYRHIFDGDGVFFCEDVNTLPDCLKTVFEQQDCKAALQSAMLQSGELRGFVGFDDCIGKRVWSSEQVNTLSYLASMVGAFIMNHRAQQLAADYSQSLMDILNSDDGLIYIIDPKTYKIEFANTKTKATRCKDPDGLPCYKVMRDFSSPCTTCPAALCIESGLPERVEIYNPKRDAYFSAKALPIMWRGEEKLLVISQDVTRFKKTGAYKGLH